MISDCCCHNLIAIVATTHSLFSHCCVLFRVVLHLFFFFFFFFNYVCVGAVNPFTATRIYLCAMKSTRIRDAHIYMRVFVTSKQLPLAPANLLCCCQNSLATLKHSCYSILTCLLWFLTLVSLCKQTPTKQ